MRRFIFYLTFILISSDHISGQQIFLDEDFSDWNGSHVKSYADPAGDGKSNGADITDVRISNDETYLFLYIDINNEINLQSSNDLTIYIDTDNNINTGLSKNGIGAEIVYYFGERNGLYYGANFNRQIYHNDLSLVTLPTVTSERFELCIARKYFYGTSGATMGNQIKIIFSDESLSGDIAPNGNGGYTYSFNNNLKYTPKPFSIKKENADHLRIMSYNVLRDNLFDPFTQNAFRRIFQASKPDIIGFCEIYDNSSLQTANLIETFLPPTGNQTWYHSEVNPDIRVVSRYPVIDKRSINGNGAFLIDLGTEHLVFIVMHLPCCENENDRQLEVDNVMSFVRSVRYGISPFQVAQNTSVIILGDTNLVGFRSQQQTLITGDIYNNNTYGPDFDPDWDDTALEDAKPAVTNLPSTFTWNSSQGSFSAGRLDYVVYTGSVMELKNAFSLWTPSLTSAQLAETGLQAGDVETASDHLPVVCDFLLPGVSGTADGDNQDPNIQLKWVDDELIITSVAFPDGDIHISIVDIMGRILAHYTLTESENEINIHPHIIPGGLFIITIQTNHGIKSIRLIR
ncbi:MAG: endonuclease/exonuclease/phosphatase family protein [Saprospiraceae bacterium]|nr:endonuclease/exonuclease/phosphatase family protein [Saprospiraceae bacterium]